MPKLNKPDWDKYLEGKKKRYVTYHEGARIMKMPYYRFTRLAREAKANIKIRKRAIVDLEVLEEYLNSVKEDENGVQEEED